MQGHELLPPFCGVATAAVAVAVPTALQQKHPLHLGSLCKLSLQAGGGQVQRGRTPGPKGAGGPSPSSWSAAETAKLRACIEAEGTGCWAEKAIVVFGGHRSAKSLEAQYYRAIRGRPAALAKANETVQGFLAKSVKAKKKPAKKKESAPKPPSKTPPLLDDSVERALESTAS